MKRGINAVLAMTVLTPMFSWAACDVKSGARTAALVELYTSEGCSSCPPADQRLSQFPSREYGLDKVVPISLHVDYWDDLGWKEPFAQPRFGERQSWLVRVNGHKTVFTPHVFVSGTEVRDWRGGLVEELKRVTAEPARASLHMHAESAGARAISVAGSADAPDHRARLALFVALTEDRITSSVSAGENRGVMLSHDHVVRQWIGSVALNGGRADLAQVVMAGPNWNTGQLGIAGFVQDLETGRVLQAAGASRCLPS